MVNNRNTRKRYKIGSKLTTTWHAPLSTQFVGGGGVAEAGLGILKENLKLHNPSLKSVFRITSLINSRYIRNTH